VKARNVSSMRRVVFVPDFTQTQQLDRNCGRPPGIVVVEEFSRHSQDCVGEGGVDVICIYDGLAGAIAGVWP
jgi:hypothetical protein